MRKMPTTRPPSMVPGYCGILRGTGPASIRQHVGYLVYLWTVSGDGFWMYPTDVSNGILYGYIWKSSHYEYAQLRVSLIDCLY